MRKHTVIFTVLVIALILSLGAFGGMAIYHAQMQEVKRVQNLAGAVVSVYPETEEAFVSAVMDQDFEQEKSGARLMSHYGYHENMTVRENYRKTLSVYFVILALLLSVSLGFGYFVVFHARRRRRRQEDALLSILDDCLSGDYGFTKDESRLGRLQNPYFADSLVKLAQSLKLKTDRLDEERDNTKTMVTDISHQLKTPISAMKVCFDMYLEAESEDAKNEFLNRSMIQMDKLEQLAAVLVNISRLENKMIKLEREDVSLLDILTGAVNAEYHKALAKSMEIAVDEFEDIRLYADRKWTTEAIANIIDNGIKYSPAESCIDIAVNKLFSFVRIEFKDRGIGIPKAEKNKIFSRFFRGDSAAVKAVDGAGVGLYLSRKIIEDQGGTISVYSRSGGGSIFVVQLPLVRYL